MLIALSPQIIGGFETTEAIRALEAEVPLTHDQLRPSTILNGRLPIIAVSASLPEKERPRLIASGFGESPLAGLRPARGLVDVAGGDRAVVDFVPSFPHLLQTVGLSSPSISNDCEGSCEGLSTGSSEEPRCTSE